MKSFNLLYHISLFNFIIYNNTNIYLFLEYLIEIKYYIISDFYDEKSFNIEKFILLFCNSFSFCSEQIISKCFKILIEFPNQIIIFKCLLNYFSYINFNLTNIGIIPFNDFKFLSFTSYSFIIEFITIFSKIGSYYSLIDLLIIEKSNLNPLLFIILSILYSNEKSEFFLNNSKNIILYLYEKNSINVLEILSQFLTFSFL